jgi:ribosome-binding factor A
MLPYEEEYGLVTISAIEVLPDLSRAHIFVCSPRSAKRLVKTLNSHAGVLKKEVSKYMTQKRTPFFVFELDTGILSVRRIDELLKE